MSEKPVIIVAANAHIQEALVDSLKFLEAGVVYRTGFAPADQAAVLSCLWVGRRDDWRAEWNLPAKNIFFTPVRLGVVADRIMQLQHAGPAKMQVRIGPYFLDEVMLQLIPAEVQGDVIRLTEKEMHVLKLLGEAQGMLVRREDLLGKVWGYVETVETHTLETHIYRLRQKIERDPARPEILLTETAGYKIQPLNV